MTSGARNTVRADGATIRTEILPRVDTAELPPLTTITEFEDLADLPDAPVSPAPGNGAADPIDAPARGSGERTERPSPRARITPNVRRPDWSMDLPAGGFTASPPGTRAAGTGPAAPNVRASAGPGQAIPNAWAAPGHSPAATPNRSAAAGRGTAAAGTWSAPAARPAEWSMDLPAGAPVVPPAGRPATPPGRSTMPPGRPATLSGRPAEKPIEERFEALADPASLREIRSHRAAAQRARWERHYLLALLVADVVVGFGACGTAFGVRFGDILTPYHRGYAILSVLLPLAFIGSLAANRAYERRYLYVGTDEYQRVLRAGLAFTAALATLAYALDVRLARGYVSIALPVAILACVAARFLLRKRLHRARERGSCLRRVILVGHELAVVALTRQLKRERYHGLKVVGACLPPAGPDHDGQVGMPVYGTFDEVAAAVTTARADTVIVLSCPELDGHRLRRLAWQLERDDVDLIVASSLMDVAGDRTTIRPVDGLPMLHVEHPTLSGARRLVKAGFDRVGSALLLLISSPLLLALAVGIRLDSPGPVLFRQVRVGKDGREFLIYKFRTMYTDAEKRLSEICHLNEHDGVLFKMRDDPRVTKMGRWLRRLSLDELPQLLNVLGGSMSLVGPRPPLPQEVAAYPEDMIRRLAVPPGMTGLWQISGRSDLPWEEAVRLDLRYVENWSLSLDLVILLRTMSAVVRSSGAY